MLAVIVVVVEVMRVMVIVVIIVVIAEINKGYILVILRFFSYLCALNTDIQLGVCSSFTAGQGGAGHVLTLCTPIQLKIKYYLNKEDILDNIFISISHFFLDTITDLNGVFNMINIPCVCRGEGVGGGALLVRRT